MVVIGCSTQWPLVRNDDWTRLKSHDVSCPFSVNSLAIEMSENEATPRQEWNDSKESRLTLGYLHHQFPTVQLDTLN